MSLGRLIKISALALMHGASKPVPTLKRKALQNTVNARGIPTKVTQVLATFKNSTEHVEALRNMEALPLETMLEVLREDAPELLERIEEISDGAYPASLGQVHQVVSENRSFALKLQYPRALQDMAFDQAWMDRLAQTFSTFSKGFGLEDYKRELKEGLLQELDFKREGETMARFFQHFEGHDRVTIPNPLLPSSGPRHLLMSWEASEPIEPDTLSKRQKLDLLSALESFFLESLFNLGEVHADPNPGNFGLRKKGEEVSWVIYDFGAVHSIDRETRLGLLLLLRMTEERKGDPYSLLVRLGFDAVALEPIRDNLLAFLFILFEPFLSEGRYHLESWNRSERTKDVLGEHRFQFMVAAPTSWIGLMRALQGFFHYSEILGVGVYLRKKLEAVFHTEAQDMAVLRGSIVESPIEVSQYLHIRVREGFIDKVKVIFKAECVECLEEIMEPDHLVQLKEQGIDLEAIKSKVRANGYRPMDLFTQAIGEKTIRVFID